MENEITSKTNPQNNPTPTNKKSTITNPINNPLSTIPPETKTP
jgi:hypothetical protein